ncbi:hypothetical protein WJX73_001572 [Symbiochloris irregularis]|uniref:Glycosyltransferase 2-like domain-containing protein n=1 Tax=Symbiochloris irregularis TaxID=706552 RepID=A0AAW1PD14_9CHLO
MATVDSEQYDDFVAASIRDVLGKVEEEEQDAVVTVVQATETKDQPGNKHKPQQKSRIERCTTPDAHLSQATDLYSKIEQGALDLTSNPAAATRFNRRRLQGLTEESNNLKTELQDTQRRLESATAELKQLMHERAALTTSNKALQAQVAQLKKANEDCKTEMGDKDTAARNLVREREQAAKERKASAAKLQATELRLQRASADVQHWKEAAKQAQQARPGPKSSREVGAADHAALLAENKRLQSCYAFVLLGDDVKVEPDNWAALITDQLARQPATSLLVLCDTADPGFPSFPVIRASHFRHFARLLPPEFVNQGGVQLRDCQPYVPPSYLRHPKTMGHKLRVRCNDTQLGAPANRNKLLDASFADYAICFDDDVVPDAGCIDAYVRAFRAHPDATGFAGPTHLPHDGRMLSSAVHMSDVSFFWEAPGHPAFPRVPWAISANFAFKTRDSELRFLPSYPMTGGGEDIDFCLRSGSTLISVPAAKCSHPLWSKRRHVLTHPFNWAKGDGHLISQFPEHTHFRAPNAVEILGAALLLACTSSW